MKLTPHEWNMIVHALRSSAEVFEGTAATIVQHGAVQLASDFQRRAREMRALADRIEDRGRLESEN